MPNESAKIILAVTHAKLSKVRDALAVEGTINALQVGFQFRTPDWDNTTKTVVFVRGRATPSTTNADTTYRILDENNECDVPPEMLAQNGMFSVGIFGVRDNYRIVSNWMCYRITDGCYADGSTPIDPSSTIYEQIISMINNKSSIGHNHDERYYTKDESNDKFLTEEDVPKQVQSDWEQNDSTSVDYIKNRTHYIKNLYPEAVTTVENPTIDTIYLLEDFTNSKVNLSGLRTYLTSDRVSKKDGEVAHYDGLSLKLRFVYSTMNFEIWPSADDISLIDTLNYKIACIGGNITFYVVLDASTLTSEYSSNFPQVGIYGIAANEYVKSMNAYVVQCYMIDDKYIPSDLVTNRNLVDLDTTDKTVVGAINEVSEKVSIQPDWNQNDEIQNDYIKNRPFYEDVSVNITWDGDTVGKTEVDLTSALGYNVYLVSDATPSAEDLIGATLSIYTGSDTMEIPLGSEYVQTISDNIILLAEGHAFVIIADNSEYNGITFPSKGTYFLNSDGAYVSGLTKKIVNKIDKKFIPNGIDTLKITVTYNSSTDTYSNADKSSDDIESCLNNGGIPYIALYGLTSVSSNYIILTYVGYGGESKLHAFANEGEGIGLYISGLSVSSGSSSQSLKGKINYLDDITVKTVSQVLTDKQKAQARENIEACDRTHRYEIVESLSNIDNNIDLLDASSEYSTIGSIIQLKAIPKILMKSLIYPLAYGHAETYDSVLSVNTYDNNLNFDAMYEYSTSDTGYSTISAIDANNYKCTLKIRNIDCFEVYFIANTSTLNEEYSSNFSATGVYLKYLATPNYASQYLRIKFKVLQYYKLSDHYLDSTVERTNHKVTTISGSATDDQYPSALAVKTELDNTVKTTEQTLTDEQKTQARTNIGAVPSPDTADVGQLLVVKTVDDEGKVTETEGLNEITLLINADLLPAVYNTDGKILTDNSGRIILRY